MKVVHRDSRDERTILIAMIVNDRITSHVADRWTEEGLFGSKWSNLVGSWAVMYFRKYGKAPGESIQNLFESWAATSEDTDTVEILSRFLESLSSQYATGKDVNVRYVLDAAGNLFNQVRIQRLVKQVQAHLDRSNIAEAAQALSSHHTIELGLGAGIDLLKNREAVQLAFEEKSQPLIRYPDALGVFYGDSLERDGFISLMAPEKRGKTWFLLDFAWMAMYQNRKVAFFSVGDMSQSQIIRRLAVRAADRPLGAKTVRRPTSIIPPDEGEHATVTYDTEVYDKELDWQSAWKALRRFSKKRGDCLKISTYPNSTLSVSGLQAVLQQWEVELGWKADVIIIDYADILAPENGRDDSREATNKTWKKLRGLSQEKHALVITATQADAGSYNVSTISRANFSEDKRKYAHVTGMIGINATTAEKVDGICRLNWIVRREDEFSEDACVHVAGSLSLGQPAILSTF